MAFKIKARSILHLGAELISSDSIALFELVKNAFDARSKNGVSISVKITLPSWPGRFPVLLKTVHDAEALLACCVVADKAAAKENLSESVEALRIALLADHDSSAPGGPRWAEDVKTATIEQLRTLIEEANSITVSDSGCGMSLEDLTEIYLTIGTRSRLAEKQSWRPRKEGDVAPVFLGEKGIGRLSVMRLGELVTVKTTKSGEVHWNNLNIDWRMFSHDSDAMLDSIDVTPNLGEPKFDPKESGTVIRISLLHSQWSFRILEKFAIEEVSKLNDPFESSARYLIKLFFNGTRVSIPTLEKNLAKYAHGYVSATLIVDHSAKESKVRVVGKVEYRAQHRERAFEIEEADLLGGGVNSVL